jgi:hypothetical protein
MAVVPMQRSSDGAEVPAMADLTLLGHEAVAQRLADALRLFVGAGRRFELRAIAESTGIPESTLKAYRAGEILPTLPNTLRLIAVLPRGFAAMLLEPLGLTVVARHVASDSDDHAIAADVSAAAAVLTEALRDGRIDHRERAAMRPQLRELGQLCLSFAREGSD